MNAPPSPDAVPTDPPDAAPAHRGVRLPGWLAVLIVACVAAGFIYLGWSMLRPPPAVDLSQYESNEGRRAAANRQTNTTRPVAPTPPPDGVTIEGNGNGAARVGSFSVRFLVNDPKKPRIVPGVSGRPQMSPDARKAVRARNVALNQAELRKAAGVTDEQIKQLRPMVFQNPKVVDAAGRAELLSLWAAYRVADAAGRPAAEKAVLDAATRLAAQNVAASSSAYDALAARIQSVLTAEQMTKLVPPRR